MKYCNSCWSSCGDDDEYCLKCGNVLQLKVAAVKIVKEDELSDKEKRKKVMEYGLERWFTLGFCFPIIGLIMYFSWRKENPNTAEAIAKGSIISIVLSIAISIFYVVYYLIKYLG